jgi:GNAT superfamily N-acetyltransferase
LSEPVHVRAVQRADFAQWSDLWDGYNTFYGRAGETALAPEVTRMTWSRFFDAYEPMHALVAEVAGRIVGLTHFLYHRSTIQIPPTCYLADLFTADAVRGQGVGRALIGRSGGRALRLSGVSTQRVKPQSLGNPPSHWRC